MIIIKKKKEKNEMINKLCFIGMDCIFGMVFFYNFIVLVLIYEFKNDWFFIIFYVK